jgi:PQQ-dependent catabolism-associated CXXCW motif protein
MRNRWWILVLGLLAAATGAWAAEDEDFGVAASPDLRVANVHAPTPRVIPGAQVIGTDALRERLRAPEAARPLLFDVLGGETHASLPGAIWLPGAGRGESFTDTIQAQLARVLQAATKGDAGRPLVFFCQGTQCWLSYNAALRAVALGYREVYWYRGGIEAWLGANEPLAPLRFSWRKPVP